LRIRKYYIYNARRFAARQQSALFAWLISHQPTVLFSQNKPPTSNQPAVFFSHNKPALAINHQPNEQAHRMTRASLIAPQIIWAHVSPNIISGFPDRSIIGFI
jgi:hypothetical protein